LFAFLREPPARYRRQRRGVLTLLLAEIEHNSEVINTVFDRVGPDRAMEDLIGLPDFPKLKARTWSNVQERAAALLPDDLMAALDGYYSPLETLLTLMGFANMVSDSIDRTLREKIQEAKPEWSVASVSKSWSATATTL
jgi:hypothetical protein